MSRSMVCQFRSDERTTVCATSMPSPPTWFVRKETGHFDGRYRIHSVEWNEHAERHEVVYMLERDE
jgi:hypothetical protein